MTILTIVVASDFPSQRCSRRVSYFASRRSAVASQQGAIKTVQSDMPLYPEQAVNFARAVDA